MTEEKGKKISIFRLLQLFFLVVLPVGRCQEELSGQWRGPKGALERAGGWEPEPAVEKQIQRKTDREEEMRCCGIQQDGG